MLSLYIHIPYCTKRCGYCDFNTYTPSELREGGTLDTVSKLKSHDVINTDEKKSLVSMIKSPDEDNFKLAEELLKLKNELFLITVYYFFKIWSIFLAILPLS